MEQKSSEAQGVGMAQKEVLLCCWPVAWEYGIEAISISCSKPSEGERGSASKRWILGVGEESSPETLERETNRTEKKGKKTPRLGGLGVSMDKIDLFALCPLTF